MLDCVHHNLVAGRFDLTLLPSLSEFFTGRLLMSACEGASAWYVSVVCIEPWVLTVTGHETPTAANGGGAEARLMKREWARYENALGAIGESGSAESSVAKRAHKRLAEIASELKLSHTGVVELANQVMATRLRLSGLFPSNGSFWITFECCHSEMVERKLL